MTQVWNKIINLTETFKEKFAATGNCYSSTKNNGWDNYLYTSDSYRRAHVEIVDFRETHKIYILHTTVFPHYNDPSPIWGFDAICGPNKITGAFHDFSAGGDAKHPMMQWFADETMNYDWRRVRELPTWARAIFSPSMVAAGNIQDGKELDDLCRLATKSLDYYSANVGERAEWPADFHMAQNKYCYYQKQNPQVVNSMIAMGIPEQEIRQFIDEVLFPETSSAFYA